MNFYQYNIFFRTRKCRVFSRISVIVHRLLVERYSEAALSESCREWFQNFKNGKFDIEDKESSGRPKVYEDAE